MINNVALRGALQGFAVGAWLWLLLIAFLWACDQHWWTGVATNIASADFRAIIARYTIFDEGYWRLPILTSGLGALITVLLHFLGLRFEQADRAVGYAAVVMLRNWFWLLLLTAALLVSAWLLGPISFLLTITVSLVFPFLVGNAEQYQVPARQFRFRWSFPGWPAISFCVGTWLLFSALTQLPWLSNTLFFRILLVCLALICILAEDICSLLNSTVWLEAPKSWANLKSIVMTNIGSNLVRNALALSITLYWLILFLVLIVLVSATIQNFVLPQLENDLYGRKLPWLLQSFRLISRDWLALLCLPLMFSQLAFTKLAAELRAKDSKHAC